MIDKETLPPEEAVEQDAVEQVEERPADLRGQLKAAFKEAQEADRNRDDAPQVPERAPKKEPTEQEKKELNARLEKARAAKAAKATERAQQAQPTGQGSQRIDDPKLITEKPPVDQPAKKESPIGYWKNKSKSKWDDLPASVQEDIIAREKEVSDGFAQMGPKVRAFDDLYKVIEPHVPAIQRFGVTIPQTIERLFSWMNALSHPDENFRRNSFKELAKAFNVKIDSNPSQEDYPEPQVNEPPPWFQQYHNAVNQEIGQLRNQAQQQTQAQQQQMQSAAAGFLANWSKDKPHFDLVVKDMMYVLESGKIPLLPDGNLDLDGAYNFVIQYNPQIQAQVQKEAAEKAQADAKAKAEADAKAAAERLARARRAGSSIRPSPAVIAAVPQGKPNSRGAVSVRESLRDTLNQLQE